MTCSYPPALTDEALMEALDEAANAQIWQHLNQCPSCAARFNAMHQFETRLRARLSRFDCPSPHTLSRYKLRLLDPARKREVARHLRRCPRCQDEIRVLSQFLRDEPLPPPASTDDDDLAQPRES